MKRILPLVFVILAIAGAVYWSAWRNRDQKDELIISGNIEVTEVAIGFKTPGKIVALLVDEGDRVRAGDLIAQLDQQQLQGQRQRAVAAMKSAQSAQEQTRAAIRFQSENVASSIAEREAELRVSQARLAALLAGSRKQDIDRARAAVAQAKAEADQAQRDLDRGRTLFANEDISAQEIDRLVAQAEATQAAHQQAQQLSALVLEGPRQEDIESGRAQVERARAALRTSKAGRLDIARLQKELTARAANIEAAQADLGVIDTLLEDTLAVSPVNGVVLTKAVEEGEIVATGTTILTIGDIENPWLRGYVNQIYQGRVTIGSKVEVTTDSFPERVYDGRLSFLASEAEFTPKQIQTREERVKLVYRVKIDIANPNQELKRNMPADAVIPLTPARGEPTSEAGMRQP